MMEWNGKEKKKKRKLQYNFCNVMNDTRKG